MYIIWGGTLCSLKSVGKSILVKNNSDFEPWRKQKVSFRQYYQKNILRKINDGKNFSLTIVD